MKSRILTLIAAVTFLAALAIPVWLAAQENQQQKSDKPQHYTVTDLGTLGGTFSEAVGINNNGSITGTSAIPGNVAVHAALWQHGVITDLGTLGGPNSAVPENEPQPNAKGEIAGDSDTTTPDPNGEDFCFFGTHLICLPFVWEGGILTALPTLGGNNGIAWQVNNQGLVSGTAENTSQDPSCPTVELETEPVIWERGMIQQLPTVSGDLDGWAFATNNRRQAVGFTGNCNSQVPLTSFHAVLWQRDTHGWTATDLGNLGGTIANVAFGINNRGHVVGQSTLPGNTIAHAFLWQDGVMTDLGTLHPGDTLSWAGTINNEDQAVGTSWDANGTPHPFLWQNGVMTDLNTLIPPNSPWLLFEALGNNDRGQIVGFGYRTDIGEFHAYVATPCDENHPGIEGCDYSSADTSTAATGVSPAPAIQASTTTQPGNPAIRGAVSPIPRPLGRRMLPWYRGTVAQPQSGVSLSPPTLTFPIQVIGTHSIPRNVTLTNTGTDTLIINSITITGADPRDFSQVNNCGSSLPPEGRCTITASFSPTVPGPRTASVTITDNAPGSPQSVPLSGIGLTSGPDATLSPTRVGLICRRYMQGLCFCTQGMVALTDYGTATLNISNITTKGNFSQHNNCDSSLGPLKSCGITVSVSNPYYGMYLHGTLDVTDNAPGSPQTVTLFGGSFCAQ